MIAPQKSYLPLGPLKGALLYPDPDLPVTDLVSAAGLSRARAVAISAVHQPEGGDLLGALRDTRSRLPNDVALLERLLDGIRAL